ncbi:hypothetical protein GCM10022281_10810 [Sphingomonas rosea]|uniref:Uncharacterized protein n=1 Tax=Sphingomonas rosea TaxID=335605 RepID=A0ABP7TXV9_9SPHN
MADLNRDGYDDGPTVERTTVVNTGGGGSGGLIAVVLLLAIIVVGYVLYTNGTFGSKTEIKVPDKINVNVN